MKRIADIAYFLVSKKPVSVILVIFAAFFISFGAFSNVETADDFESGITDPTAVRALQEFKEKFGHEQHVLIAFPISEINSDELLKLHRLVTELESRHGVQSVISLLDLLKKIKNPDEFKNYLQNFRIKNLKKLISQNDLFKNFLISEDGKAIQLVVVPDTRFPDYQKRVYQELNLVLPSFFAGKDYHVFGFMYLKQRFFEFIESNNKTFISLGFIICSALAWFFFPDLVVLILILFSIGIPTVMTFAIYFANGNKINIFTSPIIPFALIISLNEIIYLVSFFVRNPNAEKLTYDQLHQSNFHKLLRPCLINSTTTLIGFLTLSYSPSPNIRLFSLYTSLACFLSYFITFGLIFSFLKLYRPRFSLGKRRIRFGERIKRNLRNLIFRRARTILVVTLFIGILGIPYLLNYKTQNRIEDSFSQSDKIVSSWHFIGKNFSGPYQIFVMISHPQILSKSFLEKLDQTRAELLQVEGVNGCFSIVDLVKAFNQIFSDGPTIPFREELTRSILAFFDDRGISEMVVAHDLSKLLIRVAINESDDFQTAKIAEKIKTIVKNSLPEETTVELTGEVFAQSLLQRDILANITSSFAMAIAIISLVFIIVFRNLSLAFIALLINFYPILFAYAIANAIGIPLNPSTAIAGCVMSGLIVDDTLHMLTFFFDSRHKTAKRRLLATMHELSWPVIYSGILLGLGNLIFVFSDFKPFKYFGTIGALIVVIGVVGDLLVLPSCIIAFDKLVGKLPGKNSQNQV